MRDATNLGARTSRSSSSSSSAAPPSEAKEREAGSEAARRPGEEKPNESQTENAGASAANVNVNVNGNVNRNGNVPADAARMAGGLLARLERQKREHQRAAAALRKREEAMVAKMAKVERQVSDASDRIADLEEENTNLRMELDSRPTPREWRALQRRCDGLRERLGTTEERLESTREREDLRRYMDTRELMRRDKADARLDLSRLDYDVPRQALAAVLKSVCRVLNLRDLALVEPSVRRLQRVVLAVPRMERFIKDVCGLVFLHGKGAAGGAPAGGASGREKGQGQNEAVGIRGVKTTLEKVVPTLKSW